jgi:hypothetical protein
MTLSPETAMVRLRRLYRDANHCDATSNELALNWAFDPEIWATHKIRYGNWGFAVAEATVRNCRTLTARIANAAEAQGITINELIATFPPPSADDDQSVQPDDNDQEPA